MWVWVGQSVNLVPIQSGILMELQRLRSGAACKSETDPLAQTEPALSATPQRRVWLEISLIRRTT